MTKRTRRNHSGNFKAKVALAALRGDKTLTEIAQQYEVHPNQVTEWKRQLLERAADVFDSGGAAGKGESEPDLKVLHAKIGRKLPRQVDSSKVEIFPASNRSRNTAGGRLPSASWGRSSL